MRSMAFFNGIYCTTRLKSQLERFQALRAAVPAVLSSLLKPYVDYCDEAFSPGVSALTWASMNLDVCVPPSNIAFE